MAYVSAPEAGFTRVILILLASLSAFLLVTTVIDKQLAAQHGAAAGVAAFVVGVLLTWLTIPAPADIGNLAVDEKQLDTTYYLLPADIDLSTFPRKYDTLSCTGKQWTWLRDHYPAEYMNQWTLQLNNLNQTGGAMSLRNLRATDIEVSEPQESFLFACDRQSGAFGGKATINLEGKSKTAILTDENGNTARFAINLNPGEASDIDLELLRPEKTIKGKLYMDVQAGSDKLSRILNWPPGGQEFEVQGLGPARDFVVSYAGTKDGKFACALKDGDPKPCDADDVSRPLRELWG